MNPIRDERTIRALELLNEEIAGLKAALESERLARIAAERERDAAKEKAEAFDWIDQRVSAKGEVLISEWFYSGQRRSIEIGGVAKASSLMDAIHSAMAVRS